MNTRWAPVMLVLVGIAALAFGVMGGAAQESSNEDMVKRGEYLVNIAGCVGCHTPYKAEYSDFSTLTPEQLLTLVLFPDTTLDHEHLLSGGRPFDLGPVGVILTRNLTPDKKTGLGDWTDAEIETALRIGVSKDGTRLHPIMPYRNFYTLAREDVAAIIAYLRSIPAVEHEIPRGPSGEGIAPVLVPPEELLETPPDNSDPVARGSYLVNTVMSCGDCHTPLDPETGAPIMDQLLAGGQPYEGPWGIVYGANITPHPERGIGSWTDEEIMNVLYKGIRPDGRQVILMPWEDYKMLTEDDAKAIIAYLREGLAPVDNEVPLPAVNEAFIVMRDASE